MVKRLPLAPREKQILDLMSQGLTISQVSKELGITANTINTHVANARERLGMPQAASIMRPSPRKPADDVCYDELFAIKK
jgi:DNA-binding CsgD family transcriptional regulator